VPVKTVLEFVAYAKANPGKINMASAGSGSGNHIAGELFKMMTGVNLVHVPYRGAGPALVDLLGGQVASLARRLDQACRQVRRTTARASMPLPGSLPRTRTCSRSRICVPVRRKPKTSSSSQARRDDS
jgi:tripartite-type tricarboxylate transporter receptor subunit TctC